MRLLKQWGQKSSALSFWLSPRACGSITAPLCASVSPLQKQFLCLPMSSERDPHPSTGHGQAWLMIFPKWGQLVNIFANPLYFPRDDRLFCALSPSGMAFLPASISYLIGTNLFGLLATRMGR